MGGVKKTTPYQRYRVDYPTVKQTTAVNQFRTRPKTEAARLEKLRRKLGLTKEREREFALAWHEREYIAREAYYHPQQDTT